MSKQVFYRRSNDDYGWSHPKDLDVAAEVRKLKDHGLSEERKKFVATFYRRTNQDFGNFAYEKNTLCRAVEDMEQVMSAKHLLPPNQKVIPGSKEDTSIKLNFDNYNLNSKQENQIYSTSANEIGSRAPKFSTKLHPHTSKFSSQFTAAYRDHGLTTTLQKNNQ